MDVSSHDELLTVAIESFWEAVPPTWNRIRSNVRGLAAERFDISVEQFHILRHIRKGLASASQLADERQISRAAVSQTVNALVEKGLLLRHQDAEDRRFVHLALSEDGNRLLDAIFQENRAWMRAKMESLTPAELDGVIKAMDVLKRSFED
ncbi:MAG: MarR family transcriptional regulator [Caldilineaceae bacterium]|nr:MarR family transcriptional regulator [Caldilineaceae bacterium]